MGFTQMTNTHYEGSFIFPLRWLKEYERIGVRSTVYLMVIGQYMSIILTYHHALESLIS